MDAIILPFLILGGLLGAWRGTVRTVILMLSTYLPTVVSIYFFDEVSNFVDIVIANSGNSNTAAIGALGAFSGLIAFFAIVVGVFLISRFLLSLVGRGEITPVSRIAGGIFGLLSQNIAVTLIYFLMYTAIPAETVRVMHQAVWTKVNWPFHKIAYPIYETAFASRTTRFGESVASLGLASTLIGGAGDFQLSAALQARLNDPKVKNMIEEASRLASTLDVDALRKQLDELKLEDLTAENIDQMIKMEDAKRRAFLDSQLSAGN